VIHDLPRVVVNNRAINIILQTHFIRMILLFFYLRRESFEDNTTMRQPVGFGLTQVPNYAEDARGVNK
jgi:hypothetical protein